jgi:hypothetical protein
VGFVFVRPGHGPEGERGGDLSTAVWTIMVIALLIIVAIAIGAFVRR